MLSRETGFRDEWILIHCESCPADADVSCVDCPVDFVVGRDVDDAIIVDVQEERVLRILDDAGLLESVVARHDISDVDCLANAERVHVA